jgi:acyl carrier protein|tara:strand:+ start:77 stop:376 length:300 start_codon:yes stop_codon:yes gene_type:complete
MAFAAEAYGRPAVLEEGLRIMSNYPDWEPVSVDFLKNNCDDATTFNELGYDSLTAVQVSLDVAQEFGPELKDQVCGCTKVGEALEKIVRLAPADYKPPE